MAWRPCLTPFYTDSRPYAQQPFNRAAFICTCFYTKLCPQIRFFTQTPLHTEAFLQEGFYTALKQRCLAQSFFCTARHLRTDVLAGVLAQRLLHTEAFTQRSLCTEQMLHTKKFPSPPLWREWVFMGIWICFCFLSCSAFSVACSWPYQRPRLAPYGSANLAVSISSAERKWLLFELC